MQEVSYRLPDGLEAKVQEFFGGQTYGEVQEKMNKRLGALPDGAEVLSVNRVKVGRNDPCPCGSGKKFKKCCIDQVK